MVQLQMLKTLQYLVLYSPDFLQTASLWDALHFFLQILSSTGMFYRLSIATSYFTFLIIADVCVSQIGGNHHFLARYEAAQQAVEQTINIILRQIISNSTMNSAAPKVSFEKFLRYVAKVLRKYTTSKLTSSDSSKDSITTPSSKNHRKSSVSSLITDEHTVVIFFLNLLQSIWMEAKADDKLCRFLIW